MRLDDLDYELPDALIAQAPAAERTAARLLVLDRASGTIQHSQVAALPSLLRAGDLLVLNDTRVIPARVHGRRPTGGRLELLLVAPRETGSDEWEALVRGAPRAGERVHFSEGAGEWLADLGEGRWRVRLLVERPVEAWLARVGEVPLPPYIRRPGGPSPGDVERYQTTFARHPGAVAAPTAGLHFTPALFDALAAAGIGTATLTLHVGPGTFLPIRSGDLDTHRMLGERYVLPEETVEAIAAARTRGGRVVAVGTTTVRTLESVVAAGALRAGAGVADLFIRPGHRFAAIDGMLTNFHLPRTSLLALVAALAEWDRVRTAYEEAVRLGYRFYSFGDAMLIL